MARRGGHSLPGDEVLGLLVTLLIAFAIPLALRNR